MDPLGSVRYGAAIERAAIRHGISPTLLAAVAAQETGGPGSDSGSNVVGDGGHGHGLFQIDDRSWAFAATPEAMDPERNADVAAGILAGDLRSTGGDVRGALSMYNAGSATASGTPTTWGDGRTLDYADSVLRHAVHLEAMRGLPAGGAATAGQGADGALGAVGAAPPDPAALLDSALAQSQANASLAALFGGASAGLDGGADTAGGAPAASQVAPQRTWRDMVGASNAGQAADSGNADILDSDDLFGDVFDGGDGDDG